MELLAKSSPSGKSPLPLGRHLKDVVEAGECLFGKDKPTRLAKSWFRFFQIREAEFPKFVATLRATAALHDLGKANDGFQDAVRYAGEQAIRHEHLSALMIFHEPIWKWLERDQSVNWKIVLSAVLTHHQKCLDRAAIASLSTVRKVVRTPFDQPLAGLVSNLLARTEEIPAWPSLWAFDGSSSGIFLKNEIERLDDAMDGADRVFAEDAEGNRLRRSVRAAIICADASASGLRREGISLAGWIEEQFADSPENLCDFKYVRREVIKKRIADLRTRGKWVKWHTFQRAVARQPSRTLLLAPCGSGKTLAAWKWIMAQARHRPVKRIIFLYPTRATATEGFRDYVSWAPAADASLIHSTGAYELDGMFENPREPDVREKFDFGVDPRLFSVAYWSKRVFSGTVDQFLAFLHHAYGPTCLLPVLTDSIVVIDEVHSFDHAMFSSLKAFLQEFSGPVLCMTATLLRAQRNQLETQCGMAVYDDRPEDLAEIAGADRYSVASVARNEVDEIVRDAIKRDKRVLWVVNRVATAQGIAQEFGTQIKNGEMFSAEGAAVYCYHSRYTLDDRKSRHDEVVDAFKPPKDAPDRGLLAVTTQVCEMSLDLDADVLISEFCPASSIVQRMGRCNRKPFVPPSLGEVYLYPPDAGKEKPYDKGDIVSAQGFVEALIKLGRPVSQTDLEVALQIHGRRPPRQDREIPFLSSDPYADGREDPFRDIDEQCIQGVLDERAYVTAKRVRQPGLILPVPRKLRPQPCTHKDARRLVLAPPENYDPALGLCDRPIVSAEEP